MKKCKHLNYEVRQVMDMVYCKCLDCDFQWKGSQPYSKPSKEEEGE